MKYLSNIFRMIWWLFKKVLRKIVYHNFKPIQLIDKYYPKDNNLWVLGAFYNRLKDNAYYFYDFLSTNKPNISCIIFVEDNKSRANLQKEFPSINILNPFSIKGLVFALKAKVVMLTANIENEVATGYLFSSSTIIVNLWHGIILKGICLTDTTWNSKQQKYFKSRESSRYDLFIASSKLDRMINSATFGLPYSKIPITGYPRNDYLYQYLNKYREIKDIIDYFPHLKKRPKKIILYAPTKREDHAPFFFPFKDRDLTKIDEFLSRHNALMVVRGHFSNVTNKNYGLIDFSQFNDLNSFVSLNVDVVIAVDFGK